MRIVKLSKDVPGFEELRQCKIYFRVVLPWLKGEFSFAGVPNKIAKNGVEVGENILFIYSGIIIALAKAERLECNGKDVTSLIVDKDTIKVFDKQLMVVDLEKHLNSCGYINSINNTPGWNTLDKAFDRITVEYIRNEDYEIYL